MGWYTGLTAESRILFNQPRKGGISLHSTFINLNMTLIPTRALREIALITADVAAREEEIRAAIDSKVLASYQRELPLLYTTLDSLRQAQGECEVDTMQTTPKAALDYIVASRQAAEAQETGLELTLTIPTAPELTPHPDSVCASGSGS